METIKTNQISLNLPKIIAEINQKNQPILIEDRIGKVVLISEQEWNEIQETLYLQSIPHLVESIHREASTPIEECVDIMDIDW
jgi:antitoxin YefM